MDNNFEGTLILEKLAEIGVLDKFYEAVDNDDFDQVYSILKSAQFDSSTIKIVMTMMKDG